MCRMWFCPLSEVENNESLSDVLCKTADVKFIDCVLMGDFNFKDINWHSLTATHHVEDTFLNSVNFFLLIQHQLKPTRYRRPQE